jgi:hypothetical protein
MTTSIESVASQIGPPAAAHDGPHGCHAEGCGTDVPAALFMCGVHWSMVPAALRQAIEASYCPGQEADKDPSAEYLTVATAAVAAVAHKEARAGARRRRAPVQLALFEVPPGGSAT